jgi:hypothetical protein
MMLLIALPAGCAPIVTRGVAGNCSALIPLGWSKPVPPADLPVSAKLPDGHDDAKPWQNGFIEQTGQLEKANDRTLDSQHIFSTCEQMQALALKSATRKRFLGLF